MNISIHNYIDKFFIAGIVLILFSSDRNLLVTHYILGGPENISVITIPFMMLTLIFLFYILAMRGRLTIRHSHRRIIVVSIFLSLYFVAHEFIFGDGLTSLKYAIFIFIIILSLMIRYNAFYIFKILGYLGGFVSFIIVLQQILLLGIEGGDLSRFEVAIPGDEWARWLGCDFVNPYGLGLMERCIWGYDVKIAEFTINRSLFFTTEPKYLSSLLLITFSSLLLSKTNSLARSFFLIMHILAIIFSASATAFATLLVSLVLIYFKFIGPKLYSTFIFMLPIFVLPIVFYLLIELAGIEGFLLNRLLSAFSSMGEGEMRTFTVLGQSIGACDKEMCKEVGLLGNVTEIYGIVGFGLMWIFLYFAIKPLFQLIKRTEIDISTKFGLCTLLNTYVFFNIYFFGDIFNMFGLLILIAIISLPDYINAQKLVLSTSKSLDYNRTEPAS
jgi:hypothetical protein